MRRRDELRGSIGVEKEAEGLCVAAHTFSTILSLFKLNRFELAVARERSGGFLALDSGPCTCRKAHWQMAQELASGGMMIRTGREGNGY